MARRRLEEQGDTQEEILSAAFRLFGRFGYDGVSMAAVAAEAGVKKASLYYHYKSKEQLYYDSAQRLYALFDELVLAPMSSTAGGALPRFLALFDGVKRLIAEPRLADGIAGYWLAPSTADLIESRSAHEAFKERATHAIASVMEDGLEAGQLHYQGEVRMLARSVLAVIEVIALPLRGQDDEAAKVIDHLGGTFIRAYLE